MNAIIARQNFSAHLIYLSVSSSVIVRMLFWSRNLRSKYTLRHFH